MTQNVDMRRLADSPTDQDMDAIGKIGDGVIQCDICGEAPGHMWMHCDAWTKWLRFGCGCNIHHCNSPECDAKAQELRREKIAANRQRAEESERQLVRSPSPGQLARLRYRYFDSFNCSKDFREWISSIIGDEKMVEMLDVPCAQCGQLLGQPRYSFEDKDGYLRLATIDDIESYCYEVLGRNPETEPFVEGQTEAEKEIGFQTSTWDYFERQGWSHDSTTSDWTEKFHEAHRAIYKTFWDYGTFVYHMPTRTFLGKFAKRGGDWPQVVNLNRATIEAERTKLRENFKEEHGENAQKDQAFWDAYKALENQQEWVYFCGNACREQTTKEHGTLFI